MTQEVLIPKMRRIERRKFKIPLLSLVLVALGLLMIIFSSFIGFELKHYVVPISVFFGKAMFVEDYIYSFYYIPQLPVIMFVGAALGQKIGTMAVFLYLILGLFFIPIFGLGGGISYLGEYSCGYILACFPVVAVCSGILGKRHSILTTFLVAIFGILTIHFCGIIYMILVALIKQDSWSFISGWINVQSGIKIVYDIVGTIVAFFVGKFINEGLRFITD